MGVQDILYDESFEESDIRHFVNITTAVVDTLFRRRVIWRRPHGYLCIHFRYCFGTGSSLEQQLVFEHEFPERTASNEEWEPEPEYEYKPPAVSRSTFPSTSSKIKSGHSFSFRSGHFTGDGAKVKLKNGITQLDLDNTLRNTASSSPRDPLVYAHTPAGGRDPTRLLAPLSSFRKLGGQKHPTLGNHATPETRYQLGASNLRKIPRETILQELARRRKRKRDNNSQISKKKSRE